MVVSEVLVFVCVFLVVRHFWIHKRFYYLTWKIPASNFDSSLRGIIDYLTADSKKMFRVVNQSFCNENDVTRTWLGPVLFVILNNPDDVKIIFNSKGCYDKPYFARFTELKKGSLFGDIEYWRSHRKIMNPFFGQHGLSNVIPVFNEKSKILIKSIEKMIGKGEFDIFHSLTALTLETILKVMDYDVDIQNQKTESRDVFIKNLEDYASIATLRMIKVWQHPNIIFRATKLYRAQHEAMAKCAISFTNDVIKRTREKIDINNNERPRNFVEALVDPKHNLGDEELRDEVNTMILAAQDTSAIATSSTILMLAMFKDVQQKVVEELYQVFEGIQNPSFIEQEKLSQLIYMEMVISEVLRLMPVVPFVSRQVDEEIITTNGCIIPASAIATVPITQIHRNKKFWGDDANQFRPERFEKENIKDLHPYAFIPFTKGPRMCLGYRYAIYLIKIQLSRFLMRYKLETSLKFEELEFEVKATLTVCQGYKISISDR